MFNHPNFIRRREKLKPVEFQPVSEVFEPQVGVIPKSDLSGWVDRRRKVKWSMSAGRKYYLNEAKAREFETKGFLDIVSGAVAPVSDDERAEFLSQVTRISMGGTNG
jgi:hypothetical protein